MEVAMGRRMVFVTVIFTSILWLAGAPNAHAAPPWCGPSSVQAADLPQTVPPDLCDLQGVVVSDGLAGAVVPEPGTGVQVFVMSIDGTDGSFAMETAPDGTVTLLGVGDDPIVVPDSSATGTLTSGPGSRAAASDPDVIDPGSGPIQGDECTDAFYRTINGGEHDTHQWYMHASSIPGYFGVDNATVIARIREGGAHITHGTTDCSISLQPSLSISYQGTTSAGVDINNDGSCFGFLSKDGQNTVGFGPLPSTDIAITCDWTVLGELSESDMRINSDQNEAKFFGTDSKPANCNNLYDLEGVATHERGHTFGLGDLDPSNHPNLTMRSSSVPCSLEARSLGKGDIQGLNDLY
jgi:hypothetical protein